MEENLAYRGADWKRIANGLPSSDPFTRHLHAKADHSLYRYGLDRPFSETVGAAKALDIHKITGQAGIKPVPIAEL